MVSFFAPWPLSLLAFGVALELAVGEPASGSLFRVAVGAVFMASAQARRRPRVGSARGKRDVRDRSAGGRFLYGKAPKPQ